MNTFNSVEVLAPVAVAPAPLKTGESLVAAGVITPQQLHIALSQQAVLAETEGKIYIGRILVNNAFATEQDVMEAVKGAGGHISLDELLSHGICVRMQVLAQKIEKGVLYVFAGHPLTEEDKAQLVDEASRRAVVTSVKIVAKSRMAITEELRKRKMLREGNFAGFVDELKADPENGVALYSMMKELLNDAIDHRASDVHIDRYADADKCWVSYRVDGGLIYKYLLPQRVMSALLMRIKTDSDMDPSNDRVPQDGRLSFEYEERSIDIRVATQPMDGGETVTMRMLDPKSLKSIGDLFVYQKPIVAALKKLTGITTKTGGIAMISGPTGQGKSTTLYALLRNIRRDAVNVISVENPVEFRIPFVRQIQINDFLGEKMSDVLRSLLRQDPDILVIGETRDKDSADALLNFAESGHTVLTTLHAIDAIQTFERFVNMIGEEKKSDAYFILGNYLKCIVNQKLVRTLCECARPADAAYMLEHNESFMHIDPMCQLRTEDDAVLKFMMPVGCDRCLGSGHYGRTIVPESIFFPDDEEIRAEITAALIERKKNIRDITKMKGVDFYSRKQALLDLLSEGRIDISAAMGVL